jgi:thiol-disulfide isomerase/thioredoxin
MTALLPIAVVLAASWVRDMPTSPPPTAPAPVTATSETILAEVRKPGAAATLVNVWATWCGPCRDEFPDVLKVAKDLKPRGVRLVLVSVDFKDMEIELRRFLSAQGVDFRTYLREGKDEAFIDALSPNWSGAIPASFVYDASGKLVRFWEGKASYPEIKSRVLEALDQKETP